MASNVRIWIATQRPIILVPESIFKALKAFQAPQANYGLGETEGATANQLGGSVARSSFCVSGLRSASREISVPPVLLHSYSSPRVSFLAFDSRQSGSCPHLALPLTCCLLFSRCLQIDYADAVTQKLTHLPKLSIEPRNTTFNSTRQISDLL